MKTQHAALIVLVGIARSASAQDHLEPDSSALVDPIGSYHLMVREVFTPAFEEGVTSRAIVFPSFEVEYAIGLRRTKEGVEAFVLKASSSVWDVACLKMYEEGRLREADRDGKTVPLEQDEDYQELKKSTPTDDHRKIKVERRARPIPVSLATRIDTLWREMLLSVKYPAKPIAGADGVTYHFSAWVNGRGQLSGNVWSPEPNSKTGRLVALTEALADYASGKANLKQLTEQVEKATKR